MQSIHGSLYYFADRASLTQDLSRRVLDIGASYDLSADRQDNIGPGLDLSWHKITARRLRACVDGSD
jgi:hypothetical protein